METTKTLSPEFHPGVRFEYGFSGGEPLYITVPATARGYSVSYKASWTGGNCFCTGSSRAYEALTPECCPLMKVVPVVRFDLGTVDAILAGVRLPDDVRPYVQNPNTGCEGTLRTYLEALEAVGIPVEYPEGWDWEQHKE
jgi:hypothetical protein